MKKFVCPVIIIVLIMFSSCSVITAPFEVKKEAKLSMTSKKDDICFGADISYYPDGSVIMNFTQPDDLKGLTINAEEKGFNIDAYGIKDTLTYDELTNDAFLNILVKSIQTAVFSDSSDFENNENKDTRTLSLDISGIPATVIFDEEGIIKEIKADTVGFDAFFSLKTDG